MQKISCIKSFGSITGEHLFLKEIDAFFHLKNTLSFVFVHSCCFLQQSNLNLSISASCWEKYCVFQKLFWPFFCFTCSNWTDRKVGFWKKVWAQCLTMCWNNRKLSKMRLLDKSDKVNVVTDFTAFLLLKYMWQKTKPQGQKTCSKQWNYLHLLAYMFTNSNI